ncbi:hypothetical protein CR513_09577, partial [Mucuna pruriens]
MQLSTRQKRCCSELEVDSKIHNTEPRIGLRMFHAAASSSLLINRWLSPSMTSRRRCSEEVESMNKWKNSDFTGKISCCLAPKHQKTWACVRTGKMPIAHRIASNKHQVLYIGTEGRIKKDRPDHRVNREGSKNSLKEDIVSAYGKKVHQSQMASQILCDSIPFGSEHCLQDMTQHPKVLLVAQRDRRSSSVISFLEYPKMPTFCRDGNRANKAGKTFPLASSPVAPMTAMHSEGFLLTSMGVAEKTVCSKDGDSLESPHHQEHVDLKMNQKPIPFHLINLLLWWLELKIESLKYPQFETTKPSTQAGVPNIQYKTTTNCY